MVDVCYDSLRMCGRRRRREFRFLSAVPAILALVLFALPSLAGAQSRQARVSPDVEQRLRDGDSTDTRVILTATRDRIEAVAARHGLHIRKWLRDGAAVDVPAGFLARVADDDDIDRLSGDLPVQAHMAVTNAAIGADQVHQDGWAPGMKALTGSGVAVAVIDSGVASVPELRGRLAATLDFTDDRGPGRDENGHGTHVAGIIAGGSLNARESTVGVAPGATIVSLRVLDARGRGYASDVIDAIDWAIDNRTRFNIQVINLSLGAPVFQSWREDPLDQAVERAYRAGLVVVAAAGNFGKDSDGNPVRGGITAPGNSPYAITVGAVNTKGTPWRSDDEVASYSSRGPTSIDGLIKPDLVAPGNRIQSLLAPDALLAKEHPELVIGSGPDARLQLSGTSMAAAVVSGAAAVLRSAADIAPVTVRLALQISSEFSVPNGVLGAGTGELNLLAAARFEGGLSAGPTEIASEKVEASGIAFAGVALLRDSDNILWGTSNNILWGTGNNILWGTSGNILWGTSNNILWGTSDNILWGTSSNILWGTSNNILWGTSNNILWGTSNNILWGTSILTGE